jgi:hypothetical protein
MVNLVKNFEPISDRICYLRISRKILYVVFIDCYAPTKSAENNTKDDFYHSLKLTFDKLLRNCITIMVGDLNAQVGREEVFQSTVGKESLHLESNSNEIRLISFATSKYLIISSTQFQRKEIHKHT